MMTPPPSIRELLFLWGSVLVALLVFAILTGAPYWWYWGC